MQGLKNIWSQEWKQDVARWRGVQQVSSVLDVCL